MPRTDPAIVETSLPDGVVGRQYSAAVALEAGKGSTPFTWSLRDVPEALQWLTIDSATGALGGTPTAAVTPGVSFTVAVSDVIHRADSAVFTLAVRVAPLIVTDSLPEAMVDAPYVAAVTAEGGTPPLAWSLRDVPDALGWLTIDAATGALGGTPTAVVQPAATFTVAVSDANLLEGTRALTLGARRCVEGATTPCLAQSGTQCMVGTTTCQNGQPSACQLDAPSTSTQACGAVCGACGSSTADRCTDGECRCGSDAACAGGAVVCCPSATAEASCANTQNNDPDHCGSCDHSCPSIHVTSRSCSGGACVLACDAGWGQCPGDVGCDTDLNNDADHCGSCDHSCPSANVASRLCLAGGCQILCQAGYGQCPGDAGPCDTNLRGDQDCGGCDNQCPYWAHCLINIDGLYLCQGHPP